MTKTKTFAAVNDALDISGSDDAASEATIEVTGSGTITLLAEGSVLGSTYQVLFVTNLATGVGAASITAAGLYRVRTTGLKARLRCSVATSGNLVGTANLTAGG